MLHSIIEKILDVEKPDLVILDGDQLHHDISDSQSALFKVVARILEDGAAAISGNIFVWEANVTGIDCWEDGMEWNIREEDGFEVGEAIDGSGLMKKTISIPESGRIHHVVSYSTASDARTLRPVARQGVDMAV
jgi:hypothetical protein